MSRPASPAALLLTGLTLVFLARVAGQAVVVALEVSWLPPAAAWSSGLLPYPLLLAAQLAILGGQAVVDRAAWTGRAWLLRPRPRAARALRWLGGAYALAMGLRYAVTGTHAIPVALHLVLAAYLFTLARIWSPSAGRTPREAAR